MTTGLVLRCQWEAYLGCIADGTETFHLIGEGFTSFPEAKNPKEYSRKYVNYKTEKTDVIGYAPSIEYSADCICDDPVVKEIVSIHENEYTGNDTHRSVVSVNRWEPATEGDNPTVFKATKRTFAVIPGTKGDGTDALVYTGTMKAVSDIVKGTFDITSMSFVADGEATGE